MANTQGQAYVFGSPASIVLYPSTSISSSIFTGVISSESNEGFDLTHDCDTEEVKNTSGEIVGVITSSNRLTLSVNCVPSGTTAANALLTAFLADGNGTATISGAKTVTCGGIVDAVNTATSGRWIYQGGGSVKFTNSGKAVVNIVLKKYPTATLTPGVAVVL